MRVVFASLGHFCGCVCRPGALPFIRTFFPSLRKTAKTAIVPAKPDPMSFMSYDSTRPWAKAIKTGSREQEDAAVVCRPEVRPFRK